MTLRIGDRAPDFQAQTTRGSIQFHEWIGNSWCMLFSHPKDFTPVCTTELGFLAKHEMEFTRLNCKVIGLSVDPVSDHRLWLTDIKTATGGDVTFPLIGDSDLKIAKLYDMLPADAGTTSQGRTAASNQTVRTVFLIGPDKMIKALMMYPMSSGRNFEEILRLLESVELTSQFKVATPVNWKHGEDVVIAASMSDEEAKQKFPKGWKSTVPYLRMVPPPDMH
jgi:thioredoxin-dependent peroxiredoxin